MPKTRPVASLLRLVLSLTLVGGLLPLAQPAVAAVTDKPTLLGFTPDDFRAEVPDFTSEAGKAPAITQLFWTLLPSHWTVDNTNAAKAILSELQAMGTTPYVEITTDNLAALNQGQQDTELNTMANAVGDWLNANPNRHLLIAPLPEMNLVHAWGGNPSGFKSGYLRIRNAFLDQGLDPGQIRFVFAPNGVGDVGEYDDYYPGDSVVDIIGFAKINRGTPWRNYNVTFQLHIDELRSRISLSKPILITQTGSVKSGGNRDVWLNDMFTRLKAHDQVIGAIYFNKNKDHDYRVLVGPNLDPVFDAGYQQWSSPSAASWIFDGRMDAWVADREERFGSGFTDVFGHTFQTDIAWLAQAGITQGCNPPLNSMYCPNDMVTRGQMAVFLARALNLPGASNDHFADDEGQFYEAAANSLYEADITVGCRADRYCGSQRVSRGQMAAFLARALNLPGTTQDFFGDDDASEFENVINRIAEAEITLGCNPPSNSRYCPDNPVTRGQMAAFLHRALG